MSDALTALSSAGGGAASTATTDSVVAGAPRCAGLLVLDCDSTLSDIEGIDELARRRGPEVFAAVAAMTRAAMDGGAPLEDVFAARLARIQPTAAEVAELVDAYAAAVEPGAAAMVAEARSLGWQVAVVSGGLEPAVAPFARSLGIASTVAVPIFFEAESGAYAGVDTNAPTARAGGKLHVVRELRDRAAAAVSVGPAAADGAAPLPCVLVGDGVSDAEAVPAVTAFVGFGGFAERAAVRRAVAAAPQGYWVTSLAEVPAILRQLGRPL